LKIKAGEVYTFNMNNGQELIAKLLSEDDKYYHIEAPLMVAAGKDGPFLAPASATADVDGVSAILVTSVAMVRPSREDSVDAHRESITGITVPEKQIVLG